jgi:hypothetical protein
MQLTIKYILVIYLCVIVCYYCVLLCVCSFSRVFHISIWLDNIAFQNIIIFKYSNKEVMEKQIITKD